MGTQGEIMAPVGNVAKLVNRLSNVEINPKPLSKFDMGREIKREKHIVTYSYRAQQNDELSLEIDDVIEVISRIEDGWNKGKLVRTGQVGMYPTNYCETYKPKEDKPVVGSVSSAQKSALKSTPAKMEEKPTANGSACTDDQPEAVKRLSTVESTATKTVTTFPVSHNNNNSIGHGEHSSKEYAKVMFVYEAQHDDELSLTEVGAMVLVTNKQTGDPGWFEGEWNGRRGLFPDNFVELVPVTHSPNTSLTKPNEKPPAVLPGAVPLFPVIPPQVPAKPPKNVLSGSTTSLTSSMTAASSQVKENIEKSNEEPKKAGSGSTPRPFTAIIQNNAANTPSHSTPNGGTSSFHEKKNALLQNLNMYVPGSQPPRPPPPQTEPPGPSLSAREEPAGNDSGAGLVHLTKDRPKAPTTRRPVSMFPKSEFSSTGSTPSAMTKSEFVPSAQSPTSNLSATFPLTNTPSTTSTPSTAMKPPAGASPTPLMQANHKTSPSTSPVSASATNTDSSHHSPASSHSPAAFHPSSGGSHSNIGSHSSTHSVSSGGHSNLGSSHHNPGGNHHSGGGHSSVSGSKAGDLPASASPSSSSEWVSRKEYNDLLGKYHDLAERMAAIEEKLTQMTKM